LRLVIVMRQLAQVHRRQWTRQRCAINLCCSGVAYAS